MEAPLAGLAEVAAADEAALAAAEGAEHAGGDEGAEGAPGEYGAAGEEELLAAGGGEERPAKRAKTRLRDPGWWAYTRVTPAKDGSGGHPKSRDCNGCGKTIHKGLAQWVEHMLGPRAKARKNCTIKQCLSPPQGAEEEAELVFANKAATPAKGATSGGAADGAEGEGEDGAEGAAVEPEAAPYPVVVKEEPFELWPQLSAGKHELLQWPLCTVLFMDDSNFPWLVLVPRRNGMSELHDLSHEDRMQLMIEIGFASEAMAVTFMPKKVNVGALGNMCAQLHVHVIARNEGDKGWPGPAWSAAPAEPYAPAVRVAEMQRLRFQLESRLAAVHLA